MKGRLTGTRGGPREKCGSTAAEGDTMRQLVVDGDRFRTALRKFKQHVDAGDSTLVHLLLEDGELIVESPSVAVAAPAGGDWEPAGVRVNLSVFLRALEVLLDSIGDVTIEYGAGRLKFADLPAIAAGSDDAPTSERVLFPLGAPFHYLLCLPLRHDAEGIARSGLGELVNDARSRVEELLDQASDLLKPLGISKSKVYGLFADHLARVEAKQIPPDQYGGLLNDDARAVLAADPSD